MSRRADEGRDRDSGPYNYAHVTAEDGSIDEQCRVSVAEGMLRRGLLKSFDGVVRHGDATEYLYTAKPGCESEILRLAGE